MHWHAHPDVLLGLALIEGVYLLGVGPLRTRYNFAGSVDSRQTATFTAGVLVIFVSLLSPIHELSDTYLFSAHMVQHVLLTLVAPPLLILGMPDWLLRPLLRPNWAFRSARLLTNPIVAFVTFSFLFAVWHIPSLYDHSVTNHGVHIGEHILFILTAGLMWWPITSNMPELPRLSDPMKMAYLFLLSIPQIIIFAPITFASEPLYDFYVNAPRIWNVTPLVDQQIGAIIMKMGGGLLFLTLMIVTFFRWFIREEQERKGAEASGEEFYGGRPEDAPPLEDISR
jgi:putative membrane protein